MIWWIGFIAGLIVLTWLDYYLDKNRKVDIRLISIRVAVWIGLALCFNVFILIEKGHTKALEFLTGYIVEYSLSVDNLFVFIILFQYFGATGHQELKALQWGIYGAMVMRLIFILFGITLIHYFHPIIYVFGAILLYTAYKMYFAKIESKDPAKLPMVKLAKKIFPLSSHYDGDKFFTRSKGKLLATPMVILVVAVESSDVMFAVDSIPAILAITTDPFIVFSSNIFAILGLRALFFLLAGLMKVFRFLKTGVALILAFVGVKMMLSDIFHIPVSVSLGVILTTLLVSILVSVMVKDKN